jgi:hypothetical protein
MTPVILRWWIIKNSYCSKYGIFLQSIHRLVFVMETQYVWTLRLTRKCLVVHFLWTTVWDFQSSVSRDVVCLYFELILFVSEMALCFPFKHISCFVKVGTECERGQQQLTCDLTGCIWCDLQGFSSRMCALSSMAHGVVAAPSLTQLVVLSNPILVSTALLWPSVAHDFSLPALLTSACELQCKCCKGVRFLDRCSVDRLFPPACTASSSYSAVLWDTCQLSTVCCLTAVATM